MTYRPEIDGLRALAVIAVIINHFENSILPSGYLGVDIFFVISGFVITSSLFNRQNSTLGEFLLDFYVRRIKRLIPALVLFVLSISVLICLFDPDPEVSLKTGISSLFGLSNLYLLFLSTDYFGSATELNVFVHTWSLGVEEQFYLLYPFLVWMFMRSGRLKTDGSHTLYRVIGVLTIVSMISFLFLYQRNQPAAYFLMPTRLWELSAGCVLFIGLEHSKILIKHLENIPPLLVITSMVLVLFAPSKFAVPATISIVLLTATLIACLRPGTSTYKFFSRPQVVYIGSISYSLYLWHWGVIALSRWTIGIQLWSVPILVAIMLVMAILSYHLVEAPLRRSSWSHNRFFSAGYGVLMSVSSCGIILALLIPLYGKLYLGNLLIIPTPKYLQRTWWADRVTGEYIEKCHVKKIFSSSLLNECLEVASENTRAAYLIGDSHARNYLASVKEGFKDIPVRYITMGHGCSFLPPELSSRYSNVKCSSYVSEVTQYLVDNTHSGDVVFIGQRLNQARQSHLYVDFIESFAIRLGENGVSVVLFDDVVPPKLKPQECVDLPWTLSNAKSGCYVPHEVVRGAYSRFEQLALDASSRVDSLFYAPLRTGLCRDGICGQVNPNDLPIWHDRGHITEESSSDLGPLLRSHLKQQGFDRIFLVDHSSGTYSRFD